MTWTRTSPLAILFAAALVSSGCGSAVTSPEGEDIGATAAVTSAALEMERDSDRSYSDRSDDDRSDDDRSDDDRSDDDRSDDDRSDDDRERVSYFQRLLDGLRGVPQLAPLFDSYQVPNPIAYDDDEDGLVALLRAVRITVNGGGVTIANRRTGGVIYRAPLSGIDSGTFHPENMPGGAGTPPPVAVCSSFTYSSWGACQPSNTQTRVVTGSSPAGCTGGSPVTSQACTYVPPVTTCTSFTYSAWGACQPNNTQTRTVTGSSPAGCTGGSPVLSQACTYTPPACTYTYSAWSACSASGQQTRTVVSSSPAGCAGTPVLTQSCTPPAPACGTCHAIPPSSGRHSFHASFASCSTCHGTGYSTTSVNTATHQNGVVNTTATPNYNPSTNTCATSCHGTRSW